MRFFNYYTYPRFNKKKPKKLYKETNYTHSQKPPTIQFGMPKKNKRLNLKRKQNPQFRNTHF